MANKKKVETVEKLSAKIKKAKGLILSDYTGLKVSQISELRGETRRAGGEYEVVKNSLLKKAAAERLKIADLTLTGPTAALWLYEEDFTPLKAFYEFIKKTGLPKIKLGFWGDEIIGSEQIKELANLPGLQELRAGFTGRLKYPLLRFRQTLEGNTRKLLFILKAVAENKNSAGAVG